MIDDALATHIPRTLTENYYESYWKKELLKTADNKALVDNIAFEKEEGLPKSQSEKMWIQIHRVKDEKELDEGETRLGSKFKSGYI